MNAGKDRKTLRSETKDFITHSNNNSELVTVHWAPVPTEQC